jgi:hypothetical protein
MKPEFDFMLGLMLSLVLRSSTAARKKKEEDRAGRILVKTLELLGLAEESGWHGCWRATPELLRLAYQSKNFLESNYFHIRDLEDDEDESDASTEEDVFGLEDECEEDKDDPAKK